MKTFVAVVIGVFSLTAWANVESKSPGMVSVQSVERKELFNILIYPARIVPKINSQVLSETDGVITRLFAPLGMRVKKGQALVTVTHTDPVYQYAPVTLRAPVAGVVSSVEISQGSQVTKGQRILQVTDPEQVKIVSEVPASEAAALKSGLSGELTLTGDEKAVQVKIAGISPYVDPATGTSTCEMIPLNAKTGLGPGRLGEVTFKTGEHQGFLVPDFAVVYKDEKTFLRLLDKKRVKMVPVKLGPRQMGQVEILDGLPEKAQLIQRANRFLADGEDVIVENGEKK